jgi:CSLREA domain-containing protein
MKTKPGLKLLYSIGILAILSSGVLPIIPNREANGATFTVNSTDDEPDENPGDGLCSTARGACTLRAAIQESNGFPGPDQINLPEGRYELTAGMLQILESLYLAGAGADLTIIDGHKRPDRLFSIGSSSTRPSVTMTGVTLTNGTLPSTSFLPGGGIYNFRGDLDLVQSTVSNNKSYLRGAGIANAGRLRLLQSTISNNETTHPSPGGGVQASGGGIFNFSGGTVEVIGSTISGNQATRGGGIVNDSGGVMKITNSTISGNKVRTRGGGILNGGTLAISFSTITGNQAYSFVNGIRGSGEHLAGGGIYNGRAPCNVWPGCGWITMGTTILAANEDNGAPDSSPDCFSTSFQHTFISFGGNLVGAVNGNCNIGNEHSGDMRFDKAGSPATPLNPRLGALVNNGGLTPTHALLTTPVISAAVDSGISVPASMKQPGSFFACSDRDQRSFTRPVGGVCDAGAYESGGVPNSSPWRLPPWPPAAPGNLSVQ